MNRTRQPRGTSQEGMTTPELSVLLQVVTEIRRVAVALEKQNQQSNIEGMLNEILTEVRKLSAVISPEDVAELRDRVKAAREGLEAAVGRNTGGG